MAQPEKIMAEGGSSPEIGSNAPVRQMSPDQLGNNEGNLVIDPITGQAVRRDLFARNKGQGDQPKGGTSGSAPQDPPSLDDILSKQESPVPGLTLEEVRTLEANGVPVERLQEYLKSYGPNDLRRVVDQRLQSIRQSSNQPTSQDTTPAGSTETGQPEQISPIPGMTAEEVQIFAANGIPLEAIRKVQDRSDFRKQIDQKLAEFRSQQPNQGDVGQDGSTPQDQTPENNKTTSSGAANGGERGGRPPEGPRGPEGDKEWETSPERGRWLCDEIVRLRTQFSYEGRYAIVDKEGRPYLPWLYKELEAYVNKICSIRNEKDPWDRFVREEVKDQAGNIIGTRVVGIKKIEGTQLLIKYDNKGVPYIEKPPDEQTEKQPDPELPNLDTIPQLLKDYSDLGVTDERFTEVKRQLGKYFAEAERLGLLKGANRHLRAIRDVVYGSPDQAGEVLDQNLARATRAIQDILNPRRTKAEYKRLQGIGDIYLLLARERLQDALANLPARDYIEGEFRLEHEDIGDGIKETYWVIGSYPKYYMVTARTEEQFLIAKESFLRMIRRGSLGKSPESIYQHVENFKDVFGQVGSKAVEDRLVTNEFMTEQRQELEAELLDFVGAYSIESYNPKSWNDASTAKASHEGPARWVRGLRAGNGQVGAFTYMFDKEALMEVFNNPIGNKGELDIIAQHYLQDQVIKMAIERGVGIVLKNYHPEQDPDNAFGLINSKDAQAIRNQAFKENLERIGIHMPDEEFKALYEGFQEGNAHIINYLKFGQLTEDLLQKLPAELRELANSNKQLTEDQFKQLPEYLTKSMNLGRIQVELQLIRQQIRAGEKKIERREQTAINFLNTKDKEDYLDAYEQAEANFEEALNMQTVSGEKIRRGRGFLYVDRNPYIQAYQAIIERSDRIKWLLGKLEKYEETKGEKDISKREGKSLNEFGKEIQNFYKSLTDEEKRPTAQGLYGIDSKKLSEVQRRSIQIGWILSEMQSGTELASFTQTEQDLYNNLSQKEKEVYIDQLPVYQAEMFVQCGVNLTKIKYRDDADIWKQPTFASKLSPKLSNGRANPNYVPNFKATYRTARAADMRDRAIAELQKNGLQAKLYDIDYDVNGNPIGDPKPLKMKKPRLKLNSDGSIYKEQDPEGKLKPVTVGVDEVELTFDRAVDPNNIYNRYTTHTYWGYQGENRDMILKNKLFEAARRIRDGLSRPEDEDVLAGQLLIIDPTLCRVKKFETTDGTLDKNTIRREITLFQAAVEESFLSHVYINKALFKAFLSESGKQSLMRAGYNMEDWGGSMRFAMGIKELAATQPNRFARRLGAEIAIMPVYLDSMAALWGENGVIGAVSLFADKIKDIGHQGIVGQFGITKFIDQTSTGMVELYNALIGSVQEKLHVEGLYMKPTNDNDALHKFTTQVMATTINRSPDQQWEFLQALKSTFGRLEKVLKIMRPMYSDVRNSGGALLLENVDIFLNNGRFNPDIEEKPSIYMNTGTSRHLESMFYDEFSEWLVSEWPGGGGEAYPDELFWNRFLIRDIYVFDGTKAIQSAKTFKKWFFEKAGL